MPKLKKFTYFVKKNKYFFDNIHLSYDRYLANVFYFICKKCYYNKNSPTEISMEEFCRFKNQKKMSICFAIKVLRHNSLIKVHCDKPFRKIDDISIFTATLLDDFDFRKVEDDTLSS